MHEIQTSINSQPMSHAGSHHDVNIGTESFANGYHFPPRLTWTEASRRGLRKYYTFLFTPTGFLLTIYGLNVFAWGAMLFLLIINAVPAMCKPTCSDNNSQSKKWIEIDSQILNGFFCVSNFGPSPWRFRDLCYLMRYRVQKNQLYLRKLAAIHRNWFRLPGSQDLPENVGPTDKALSILPQNALPYPTSKTPKAPLTGIRAPPSAVWKLDLVIWALVWNTLLQVALSGLMWGLDRQNRPGYATGVCVTLACMAAGVAGATTIIEKRKIEAIEGIELMPEDQIKLDHDREAGIIHWNNRHDKCPKKHKTVSEKEEGGRGC